MRPTFESALWIFSRSALRHDHRLGFSFVCFVSHIQYVYRLGDLMTSFFAQVPSLTKLNELAEIPANKLMVIDFFATWCGPCRYMSPQFDKLAETTQGRQVLQGRC